MPTKKRRRSVPDRAGRRGADGGGPGPAGQPPAAGQPPPARPRAASLTKNKRATPGVLAGAAGAALGLQLGAQLAAVDTLRAAEPTRRADVQDTLTRLPASADLGPDQTYLDDTDTAEHQSRQTAAAVTLQAIAAKRYVTAADLAAAVQAEKEVEAAATALREKAAAAKAESDRLRAEIQGMAAQLTTLAEGATQHADFPYLTPGDRQQFETTRAAVAKVLSDNAGEPRVLATARDAAATEFDSFRAAAEALPQAATKARTELEAAIKRAQQRTTGTRKAATGFDGLLTTLGTAGKTLGDAQREKRWDDARTAAATVLAESDRIDTLMQAVQDAANRIDRLPTQVSGRGTVKIPKVELSQQLNALRAALRAGRADAQALLTALGAAVQSAEAAVATAAADRAAIEHRKAQDAALRQQARSQGLLGGDGVTVITTATRATVGTAADRPNVSEALDALAAYRAALRQASESGGPAPAPPQWASAPRMWDVAHTNESGALPGTRKGGGYTEYRVRSAGGGNVLRLVRHNASGAVYYSPDHYASFVKVTDA